MTKQKSDQDTIKKQILQEAVDEIEKKFGEGAIMRLRDTKSVNIDSISTGSIGLDLALGIGGVPRGRIIEIYGNEMSGKTTLALHILAEAQKKGGIGAFIDAEHAMDPDYAKRIGVNTDDLLISHIMNGDFFIETIGTDL